jgi:tRNA U34 5-methylaminomethyl-2-thiouridine-forming methyltransferase MnmC
MIVDLITTKDGSHTLYRPDIDEQYHSVFGAIQESMHIFIQNGFRTINKNEIQVFEMGFGTGLNVLLTLLEAGQVKKSVKYYSIEKFPVSSELVSQLNYPSLLPPGSAEFFKTIHNSEWDYDIKFPEFILHKIHADILEYRIPAGNDLVYFDAFSPDKEPELWTENIFRRIYDSMTEEGVFITYSAKGEVRRKLQSVGFRVEKREGPPGKKHIVRAVK